MLVLILVLILVTIQPCISTSHGNLDHNVLIEFMQLRRGVINIGDCSNNPTDDLFVHAHGRA